MAESLNATNIFYALSGGVLPVLLWLWFWLKEDRHPEPRGILILIFLNGMLAVLAALVLERFASAYLSGAILLLAWAFIEEILKYLSARVALTKSCFDEPIDALVYLITAALGFASLENFLFILKSFASEGLFLGFVTGNLRFIGATLLHTATSAIVGASIAFAFFHKEKRARNVVGGVILASLLHLAFNYFIIKSDGENLLKIFIPLWLGIIIVIFLFEKIKRIKK